jgi:DNA repair protein RecN (Recombination protein N)
LKYGVKNLLVKLYIQNFALIDSLEIELHPGFNVLTGETGAGKSIIIDAVGLVLGEQGSAEFIRSGQDKALVEAFFDIGDGYKNIKLLEEYGFSMLDEDYLILTRELVRTGKNICRINGRQVNLSLFRNFR